MNAYFIRLARESLSRAIRDLEETQEYLAQARDCTPQIYRQQANVRRLQKDQAELAAFLRDGLAEDET